MTPDLVALARAILDRVPGDAILVLPEGASLATDLATHIGPDRLFAYPALPPIWRGQDFAAGPPPVILGADDDDVIVSRPAQWPASVLPARHRQRRCDTLHAGRPISLLLLAAPADAPAILSGATACLAAARTIVVLALQGDQGQGETLAAARAGLSTWRWQGFGDDLWCALPADLDFDPAPHIAPAALHPITIPADDALIATGLHAAEPGEPRGGRWTGAAMQTRLLLPRPPPGRWRLWFGVADWGNAAAGFDAGLDGIRLPPDGRTETGFGPAPITIPPGPLALKLDLYPPLGDRDLIRWPRRIGTRLATISLSPV